MTFLHDDINSIEENRVIRLLHKETSVRPCAKSPKNPGISLPSTAMSVTKSQFCRVRPLSSVSKIFPDLGFHPKHSIRLANEDWRQFRFSLVDSLFCFADCSPLCEHCANLSVCRRSRRLSKGWSYPANILPPHWVQQRADPSVPSVLDGIVPEHQNSNSLYPSSFAVRTLPVPRRPLLVIPNPRDKANIERNCRHPRW